MSEKSVILHEEITSSQADTVSVVGSARTHFAISINFHVPLKKNFLWIWARRVRESGWSSEIACCWRSWRNWRRCGEKADIEGEVIDVVFSAPALAISGFELHGFIFSELVRRKGLEGQTLSECVVDTARPPQCEFSNLQNTINLLFRFSCRPVIFLGFLCCARWNLKMTSWGYCVKCIIVLGNHLFIRISPGPLGLKFWDPSLKLLLPIRRRMSGKGASRKRSLTAALESLILSNLHCGFVFGAVVYYPRFCRSCRICS